MKDKELEIALNDDNTISFSDYINTRIAYETVCQEKDKEIERLNNIINELEKYIKTDAKIELYKDVSGFRTFVDGQDLLNKLQELKGSNK